MIHHRQEGGHHGSSCRDQKLISKCRCMSNTDSEGTAHLMSDFSDHFNRILMENGLGNSAQIWSDIPTEILCATLNWKWFFQCSLQYLKRCNPILKKPLSIKNIYRICIWVKFLRAYRAWIWCHIFCIFEHLFWQLRGVWCQNLQHFLKIYECHMVYMPLFGPFLHTFYAHIWA